MLLGRVTGRTGRQRLPSKGSDLGLVVVQESGSSSRTRVQFVQNGCTVRNGMRGSMRFWSQRTAPESALLFRTLAPVDCCRFRPRFARFGERHGCRASIQRVKDTGNRGLGSALLQFVINGKPCQMIGRGAWEERVPEEPGRGLRRYCLSPPRCAVDGLHPFQKGTG